MTRVKGEEDGLELDQENDIKKKKILKKRRERKKEGYSREKVCRTEREGEKGREVGL